MLITLKCKAVCLLCVSQQIWVKLRVACSRPVPQGLVLEIFGVGQQACRLKVEERLQILNNPSGAWPRSEKSHSSLALSVFCGLQIPAVPHVCFTGWKT